MYITTCKIDDQSKFNTEAGHSKPVLWDNLEGEMVGREGGRGFRKGGHMCTCGPFMLMYGKNHENM